MTHYTRDNILHTVRALRDLHDEIGGFLNGYEHKPSPNSQAALELRTYQRPESLTTAYSGGSVLIEVAADQLIAFAKTVTEPVQTIAPWTCVRAVLESSALATWMLDPNIDARTRVQRSLAFRYEGLSQQAKYGRASDDKAATAKVIARIDEIERGALGLGFPRVENKKGKRIGIAQRMPSITDIIAQALDEEASYRLLSAMAHAHPWALQQLSFRQIGSNDTLLAEESIASGRIHLVEKNLEPLAVAFLCNKAANAFARPILYETQLFGWDTARLRSILDSALGSLGAGERWP